MNEADQAQWKSEALDLIFAAIAGSEALTEHLVFKGARVLNLYLEGGRRSLDIDSNLRGDFVDQCSDREDQRRFLEEKLSLAINHYLDQGSVERFELVSLRVKPQPPKPHPHGWDAFDVRIKLNDLTKDIRGLPALEIDVAAPERLREASVTSLQIEGHEFQAYSLERIAGEKLRAFLSSLPSYRAKVRKPGDAVRAKDLYDIARIRRARPGTEIDFWKEVGEEFRLACESRYIDCVGLETFREQWLVTEQTYQGAAIPEDIPIAEVEQVLREIVELFEEMGILPLSCPLPEEE